MKRKFVVAISTIAAAAVFFPVLKGLYYLAENGVMLCNMEYTVLRDASGNFVKTVAVYHPLVPFIWLFAIMLSVGVFLFDFGLLSSYSSEEESLLGTVKVAEALSSADEDDRFGYIQTSRVSNYYEDDEPRGLARLFRRQDIE